MHIFVQIPCLNEENQLADVIAEIRRETSEFKDLSVLIIEDGSTDKTAEVARAAGADYIASHNGNCGLAKGYITGLQACLNLGADNQYKAENIPDLISPILEGQADLVVGCRPIEDTEHFSPIKKRLHRFGTSVVRALSGTSVQGATSGFRALSHETALRLHIFGDYTYTLETLIQAGRSGSKAMSVDIKTNPPTREPRLISLIAQYVMRSAMDIQSFGC